MIHDWEIATTPFIVVDVETTGLNPGADRVVEVAAVRLENGSEPEVVFDSLINPNRAVTATGKHGIRLEDLAEAPRFESIAGELAEALSGAVLAGHNALFDIRFLAHEFGQVGLTFDVPYLCTLDLRPLLGLGDRMSLEASCRDVGLDQGDIHSAREDAIAAALLLRFFLQTVALKKIQTFRQLGDQGFRAFMRSWHAEPLCPLAFAHLKGQAPRVSKRAVVPSATPGQVGAAQVASTFPVYATALMQALSDMVLTEQELECLRQVQTGAEMSPGQLRAIHAAVYTFALSQYSADGDVDEDERAQLAALHSALHRLGWAPGD